MKNYNNTIDSENLSRHFIALGASGSGKTVLCKGICEDLILDDIPVLAIDVQGDLISLAQSTGTPESNTISKKVNMYTICGDFAERLALNPFCEDNERSAMNICKMINTDDNELVSALTKIIHFQEAKDIYGLDTEGFEHYTDFASKGNLNKLARAINGLRIGSSSDLFEGRDIEEVFGTTGVIYINHLPEDMHASIIGVISEKLYEWGKKQPDDGKINQILYIDEISPFMPPVKNTPAKESLVTLLRKARKYGIGLILATQSPGDIDYKALGNIKTWALGKIITSTDLKKVSTIIDPENLKLLPYNQTGEFIVKDDSIRNVKARWLHTKHEVMNEMYIYRKHRYRRLYSIATKLKELAKTLKVRIDGGDRKFVKNYNKCVRRYNEILGQLKGVKNENR